MIKIYNIIKGWYRFLFKKRSEMSSDRIKICKSCELRKAYFCSVCWCELDALSSLRDEEDGICKHPDGSKWESSDKYYSLSGSRKHPLADHTITHGIDEC